MLCSFLLGSGTGKLIPGSNRFPGSHHTAAATKQSSQNRVWGVCQTQPVSAFNIPKETLLINLSYWRRWQLGRGWFSHSGHWLTPARVPFLEYWWSIRIGKLHDCHINLQDWQDIELAQLLIFFQHGTNCSMLCSFLLGTATGNLISGSNRIPGSRRTSQPAKQSSQHEVWGVCQAQACSAFNIAEEKLFIDLISGEDGNWEEDGSLTVVTGWHLQVFPFFGIGDRYELDCCINATSICKTGRTLN